MTMSSPSWSPLGARAGRRTCADASTNGGSAVRRSPAPPQSRRDRRPSAEACAVRRRHHHDLVARARPAFLPRQAPDTQQVEDRQRRVRYLMQPPCRPASRQADTAAVSMASTISLGAHREPASPTERSLRPPCPTCIRSERTDSRRTPRRRALRRDVTPQLARKTSAMASLR